MGAPFYSAPPSASWPPSPAPTAPRRPRPPPRRGAPLLFLQGVLLAAVTGLGILGLVRPSVVPGLPKPGSPAAYAVLAVGAAFYGVLLLRALRTFLLTRRRADVAVVVGIAWLTAALPGALLMTYHDLGWWLGPPLQLPGGGLRGLP